MSTFTSRHGPNVSQYLRELNRLPVTNESTREELPNDDELALFSTTQFFDFDLGQNTDFQAPPVKPDAAEAQSQDIPADEVSPSIGEFANSDFMPGDFSFGDFGTNYASPTLPDFRDGLGNLQPIQPSAQSLFHDNGNFGTTGTRIPGDKRKSNAVATPVAAPSSRPMSFEEASRLAAEEDKRRRNTAASARFRIKKKQREQALEKSAKEMNDKVNTLENRISQLETENKWLKNLIMEKNDGNQDVAKLWKDFSSKQESEKKAAKVTAKTSSKAKAPASPTESTSSMESSSPASSASSKKEK